MLVGSLLIGSDLQGSVLAGDAEKDISFARYSRLLIAAVGLLVRIWNVSPAKEALSNVVIEAPCSQGSEITASSDG